MPVAPVTGAAGCEDPTLVTADNDAGLALWRPPPAWRRITTIDVHTAGEPLRIVTGGVPEPPGATMLEKRRSMRDQQDDVRRLLMAEPRGHADMYGCLLTRPTTPAADAGVLFFHNEGYSTMCGHGVIGAAAVLTEAHAGTTSSRADAVPVRLDTPAGLVTAVVHTGESGRGARVTFENVPSFAVERDLEVRVPGIGLVRSDVAFGGAFYAFVEASAVGLALTPASAPAIVAAGRAITRAVAAGLALRHPSRTTDLDFLYGTIFTGPSSSPGVHSRQACVFADGQLDRSPTGTGVSARLALLAARGDVADGATVRFESLLGTIFTGRLARRTTIHGTEAVVPEIGGSAHVTGVHEFVVDPSDPLSGGFLLSR